MRAFFDLVEADRVFLPRADLSSLGDALVRVLRKEGIVRDGDPGMVEISPTDLGRVLRKLYGILSRGLTLPSVFDPRPVLLGWTGEGASQREIVLVAQPGRGLHWALRRPWRSLVLVPTSRALTREIRRRHAPGALIEVEALDEVLVARGGRLLRTKGATSPARGEARARVRGARSTKGAGEGTEATELPPVRSAHAPFAGAERWNQVGFCKVNGGLLRVDLPGRSVRCTPADLGMENRGTRKPTVLWEALLEICEGRGFFRSTRFGGVAATAKVVSRVRARLHAGFDIAASPFHRYRKGTGWRARFAARPDLPGDTATGGASNRRLVYLGDNSYLLDREENDFSGMTPKRGSGD